MMMVMTIDSYLSDHQYQDKKGSCQLPGLHGRGAPFSSSLSLTRLLLFLHNEAPVYMTRCQLVDQIYTYLIPVVTAIIKSASDYNILQQ